MLRITKQSYMLFYKQHLNKQHQTEKITISGINKS